MKESAIVQAVQGNSQENQYRDITLTKPEQIKEFFERAKKLTETVKNVDNQSVIECMNNVAEDYITKQQAAFFYLPANNPLAMANEYQTFFLRLIEDSTLIDSCEFCNRALERLKIMKSTTLAGPLKTNFQATLDTRGDEFRHKYEAHRRAHVEGREDTSVKGLTFVAYGVYLNVISNMVPGVGVHVPGYALFLAIAGVVTNHFTTNYTSPQESMSGAYHVVDRVLNNSGLTYCWNTLGKLVEKTSVGIAHRANQFMDGQSDQNFSLPTPQDKKRLNP